ncbi:hypothetical protein [Rhizorhapis suberifaciens]|uniref:Uncharacterized protein n=1 Tax=Rhizorhapis suberifaciens TaxID=13656 RepID=A0A840HZ54_9SPHN|nr:hypothetical protein [Rhizorhapis suberifaciens]MBB4642849.1 hypothetical protein [Rhizorhapis suberifaciens]
MIQVAALDLARRAEAVRIGEILSGTCTVDFQTDEHAFAIR